MSILREKEKVRDGYLQDLPEAIQNKVYAISKMIIDMLNSKLDMEHYEDLTKSNWAMSCIDDFKAAPSAKGEVGSVRVYRAGKQYRCMIQITGHFMNHQYGWIEELLHEIIADTFQDVKPDIRRKFDINLVNEGDKGNPYEGFDIFLKPKDAQKIWELFDGRKTKTIKESIEAGESTEFDWLTDYYENYADAMTYDQYFEERSHGKLRENILGKDTTSVDAKDSKKVLSKFKDNPEETDSKNDKKLHIHESADNTPEYNVDMTETQAKKTLRTLSQDIINKASKDKNYKITQYTANIYANIITKNLLPRWSEGYKKLSITLDSYQSMFTFEFKIPTMSQDFVSRFINGREPINAFLHRVPEIKIKMSPRIFHTMKNPDDAFNFFRAAVRYYDQKVENYSKRLMSEALKMNSQLKHLVSTTNLSAIVTCPIQLLFTFSDVHMDNPRTFLLSDDDLRAVNGFIKGIYTKYAAPEKEKKKIVDDLRQMVKELRESCDDSDNLRALSYMPEAVNTFLSGGFNTEMNKIRNKFMSEQVDLYEMENADPELKYVRETFGVKKLKRIPNDIVAYISIETEAIETPNDKMMIASYCLSKIEIVEWYIELLDVGSKKYVVPHTKPYLQGIRTQLLRCYDKIMKTPVKTNRDRPLIDIKYPEGYEG